VALSGSEWSGSRSGRFTPGEKPDRRQGGTRSRYRRGDSGRN